jgi:methyl-accepting chemotaxis protein
MEVNKKTITTALETLDKLLVSDEGNLLARIRDERKAYGFVHASRQAAGGRPARRRPRQLRSDMLPKLSRLQDSVRELNEMQKAAVTQNGNWSSMIFRWRAR